MGEDDSDKARPKPGWPEKYNVKALVRPKNRGLRQVNLSSFSIRAFLTWSDKA